MSGNVGLRSPNAGLMLNQRLRRWFNIKPALGKCCVCRVCGFIYAWLPDPYMQTTNVGVMSSQRRRWWPSTKNIVSMAHVNLVLREREAWGGGGGR